MERGRHSELGEWFTEQEIQMLQESVIILMAGLPGSGKSQVAHSIKTNLGGEVLRSDDIRVNKIAGSQPLDIDSSLYDYKSTLVYSIMRERMIQLTHSGTRAIVDATHINNQRRPTIERISEADLLVFSIMVLVEADEDVIRERQRIRPGRPNKTETWEDAWWRVRSWFKEQLMSGEYTYPTEMDGIRIIRAYN